jgi:hypothetical protein
VLDGSWRASDAVLQLLRQPSESTNARLHRQIRVKPELRTHERTPRASPRGARRLGRYVFRQVGRHHGGFEWPLVGRVDGRAW